VTTTVSGLLPGTGRVVVTVDGAAIASVEVVDRHEGRLPDGDVDLVLPGLVDLQVNGYAGIDLNDGQLTADRMLTLVDALAGTGVTSFCPTLVTAPPEALVERLAALAAAGAAEPRVAAAMLGVHLEGPWISAADGPRGAHPATHVRPATVTELDALCAAGADLAVVTLAPEQEGAAAVTRAAAARGIVVAIGHSGASPDQVTAAVDAGATLATHLGNGVASQLPRHPNLLWALLADDRVTASFIADGHHLDATTLRAMTRAKGADRTILVSDTTSLGGLAPGRYATPIGGDVELDADGRLGMVGSPYLAGAARSLLDGLAMLLRHDLLAPADAVAAVTSRPARLLGERAAGRGVLEPGARADVVLARWRGSDGTIAVTEVLAAGRAVGAS